MDGYGSPFRKLSDSSYAVLHNLLLSDITGVQIQVLAFVFFIQQSFKAFGIMHFCRRGIIRKYDLIAFLNFSMLLVAVKSLITLLCPAGIYILVALLVGIVIPQLITRSLFYLLIFITGVTLARAITKLASMMRPSMNCRPLLSMKL